MKKWMLQRKSANFEEIARKYNISPITARVMRNRDIVTDEEINKFLNGTLDDLYDPFLLKDMDKAVEIICNAIEGGKKIKIVGDYDIDGVCSTAIFIKALNALVPGEGEIITYRLPDRIKDGYGLNMRMIDEALAEGVDLIITCDNGIAAYDEIAYAKQNGLLVVVTDHHEIPVATNTDGLTKEYIIPPADAVVNPHQVDCKSPFKEICGGMVAYKVVTALFRHMNSDVVENLEFMDELTTLAAFATVGDIMPLVDENRIVVRYGIDRLKHTSIYGLSALMDVTSVQRDKLAAYHIGFILGPCINAAGRLYSAVTALELILSDSYEEALPIAKEVSRANDERKAIMEKQISTAEEIVTTNADGHDYSNDTVLVLYLPDCHEAIAGLVAGRINERFYKPVIVITDAENGAKGSGRSIAAYDMFEELTKVKHLFTKFGGHRMAAGLSLPTENIDELRRLLNINSKLTDDDLIEKLSIDIDMPINYVSKDLIDDLQKLGPFGNGNPGPLFAQKDLTILSRRTTKTRTMVFMNLKSGECGDMPEKIIEAKIFANADVVFENLENRDKITVAYSPGINSYMGVDTIQISIKDYL